MGAVFFRFEVAIKEAIVQNARYELFEEAKAMIRVSKHDHIVNLQGICDSNDSVYLLLEFCALGPIDDFLKGHALEINSKLSTNGGYENLIHWCIEVADGMEFLSKKNIIHVSPLS